jgi:hypothetical protein
VKIQCQVSSGERTALAANSINCNPWNQKEKKKRNFRVYDIYTGEQGNGARNSSAGYNDWMALVISGSSLSTHPRWCGQFLNHFWLNDPARSSNTT